MAGNKNENNKQESPALKWIRNAILGATMADQPSMMTASGWRLNEKGDYVLDLQDNPDVKLLRDNLANEAIGVVAGEFGVPALLKLSSLGLRGLGLTGNNWARAKIISKEMLNIKNPTNSTITLREISYQPTKSLPNRTYLSLFERPISKISVKEYLGIPKGDRNQVISEGRRRANSTIRQALELPTQKPKTISSLSEIPRASQNIPTSGQSTRFKLKSEGNTRLSPEALETILYIKNNVEPLSEFRDPTYYDAFMKHMDELGIETGMLDISPKTLALILTDLYNHLSNTATGVVRNKVFGRVDPKPFTHFSWLNHLGENTGNTGFWGAGNYFSTGMSRTMRPFIISDIDELAYDDAFNAFNRDNGIHRATKWMLDNPQKRMVVSTPNGRMNRYGYINDANDFGIEVVTLKNTGIKSLFPDFTTGNGLTFVRNWKDPNIFRGLSPIIGLGTLYGINKNN